MFTSHLLPGGRIRIANGPVVHPHSISAARKAYPDPEWSSRLSSLAIHRQEGVSGPRAVQSFIFTRYPPPGGRFRAANGPAVRLHSPYTAGKAYPVRELSRHLSSLAIRRRKGLFRP